MAEHTARNHRHARA